MPLGRRFGAFWCPKVPQSDPFGVVFDDFWGYQRICENGALAAVPARSGGFGGVRKTTFFRCFIQTRKRRVSESIFWCFLPILGGPREPIGLQNGSQMDKKKRELASQLGDGLQRGSRGAIWEHVGLILELFLSCCGEELGYFYCLSSNV